MFDIQRTRLGKYTGVPAIEKSAHRYAEAGLKLNRCHVVRVVRVLHPYLSIIMY